MKLSIIIGRAVKVCFLSFLMSSSQLTVAQDNHTQKFITNEALPPYRDSPELLNIIGAVLGLIGIVLLYQKWKNGDAGCGKLTAVLTLSCILLAILATVLKLFFKI